MPPFLTPSRPPCHRGQVANVTKALGGSEMTRVQQKALPAVLTGGDCLVRSQTGSGKTLAYLLPVIQVRETGQ